MPERRRNPLDALPSSKPFASPPDPFADVRSGSSTTATTAQRRPLPQLREARPQADPRLQQVDTDRFLRELSDPSATFAESQRRSFDTELAKRPQPTISADRRLPGQRIIAQAPNKTARQIGTTPRLGDQTFLEMGKDALASEGMFAPDKPAGFALDMTLLPAAARMGGQARKALEQGHPGMAAVFAAAGIVPVVGAKAGKLANAAAQAERRILPNAPFRAYSRLEDAIERAPFERGTAEQWKAALSQNVAAGERQFTGVDAFLEANAGQVIEREQVRALAQKGSPKVVATTLGKAPPRPPAAVTAYEPTFHPPMAEADGSIWISNEVGDDGLPKFTIERDNPGIHDVAEATTDAPYLLRWRLNGEDEYMAFPTMAEARAAASRIAEATRAGQNPAQAIRNAPAPAPEPLPQGWSVEPEVRDGNPTGRWFVMENGNVSLIVGSEDYARRQARNMAPATDGPPRFDREAYNEPGGTDYHERLIRLEREPITELPEGYGVKRFAEASRENRMRIAAEMRTIDEQIEQAMDARPELRDVGADLPPNIRALYDRLDELENQRMVPDGNTHAVLDAEGHIVPGGTAMTPAEAKARAIKKLTPAPFVQSGHFPQPNIMVHYRADMRKVGDENVMFLQEIQSDWMQKLRARQTAEKKLVEIPKRIKALEQESGGLIATGDPAGADRHREIMTEMASLRQEIGEAEYVIQRHKDVPGNVPFTKTDEWIELALKDAISEAHRRGADRIAWTTGLQQQKRWSVGNATDHIEFNPETGLFRAYKNGSEIHQGNYDPRALDEVVGKGPRERLLAAPKNEQGFQALKGEELRILETWPLITYDQGIPKGAQALAKKLGIKLDIEPIQIWGKDPSAGRYVVYDEALMEMEDEPFGRFATREEAERARDERWPHAQVGEDDRIPATMEGGFSGDILANRSLVDENLRAIESSYRREFGRHEVPMDFMEIEHYTAWSILKEIKDSPSRDTAEIITRRLTELEADVGQDAAAEVASYLGGDWKGVPIEAKAGLPNQSFRMKPFSEHLKGGGALPLWGAAAAAAGMGAASTAEAQGKANFSDVKSGSSTTAKRRNPLDALPPIEGAPAAKASGNPLDALPQDEQYTGMRASWEYDIKPALRNPGAFLKGIPKQISADYEAATNPNIEGGYKTDVTGVDATGMPLRRPMAEAEVVQEGEEGSQTMAEWQAGARRTGINAATAPISLAKAITRVPLNAALGALDSPDDRIRGATSGAVLGEALARAPRVPGQIARAGKRIANRGTVPATPDAPAAPPEPTLADLQTAAAAAKTAYDDAAWKVRAGDDAAKPAQEAARAELTRLDAIISAKQRAQAEAPAEPVATPEPEAISAPEPEPTPTPKAEPAPTGPRAVKEATVDAEGKFLDARAPSGGLRDFRKVSTDGLIRERRALEERMRNDANATAYRPVETQSSGTQADIIQMAGTRTPRGTTYQAEALQRLKNAEKVKARLEAELESRGISRDEMNRRIAEQEDFERAVEAERIDHDTRQLEAEDAAPIDEMQGRAIRQTEPIETADNVGRDPEAEAERAAIQDEGGDTSFDFDNDPTAHLRAPREYLNLARTGLDKTGEARVREIVERGRAKGTIDKGYRSFDEADVGALKEKADLVKKLVEDPLLLDRQKLRNVSTDEIKAMWMVVGDNTKTLEAAARVMNDADATPAQRAHAAQLYDDANKQTESLVSSIVTETAQKGRELGALRNIAKQSTDAEVWLVQAKRLSPDRPLPDGVMANIRRLAREAAEVCANG